VLTGARRRKSNATGGRAVAITHYYMRFSLRKPDAGADEKKPAARMSRGRASLA
jgi:hypothetical protein